MWQYKYKEITEKQLEGYVGFVYLIENKVSGRKYLGKKILKFSKTKQVKGKKKKIKVESNWKEYYGSNKALIADVEKLGKDQFKRTILHLCESKGLMNYYEAYEQFYQGALLDPIMWYNEWITCKIHISHLRKLHLTKH